MHYVGWYSSEELFPDETPLPDWHWPKWVIAGTEVTDNLSAACSIILCLVCCYKAIPMSSISSVPLQRTHWQLFSNYLVIVRKQKAVVIHDHNGLIFISILCAPQCLYIQCMSNQMLHCWMRHFILLIHI